MIDSKPKFGGVSLWHSQHISRHEISYSTYLLCVNSTLLQILKHCNSRKNNSNFSMSHDTSFGRSTDFLTNSKALKILYGTRARSINRERLYQVMPSCDKSKGKVSSAVTFYFGNFLFPMFIFPPFVRCGLDRKYICCNTSEANCKVILWYCFTL